MLTLNVDRARIISCMALYILSLQFLHSNSRFSTHWKLNEQESKIVKAFDEPNSNSDSTDYVFQILNSAIYYDDYWVVEKTNTNETKKNDFSIRNQADDDDDDDSTDLVLTQPLSCGPDVNFTTYDHLAAMAARHNIKSIEEHEISFKSIDEQELLALERQLKLDIKNKPHEAFVYNAAGSYFFAFGESQKGINCFRKALMINSDNPDTLLNLARIFYTLNYLDDALYLAQRSLDVQLTTGNSAWFHYFSVGEILKAKGDFHRANMHFRISVKLNPHFEPAIAHLSKIELITEANTHFYVSIFIVCFVVMIANFIWPYEEEENIETKRERNNRSLPWQTIAAMGMAGRCRSYKK